MEADGFSMVSRIVRTAADLVGAAPNTSKPATQTVANDKDHLGNVISGVLLGGLVGGGLGLGACIFLIQGTLLFAGDTVLFGAVTCGALGFFIGEDFIAWLKENWLYFWS